MTSDHWPFQWPLWICLFYLKNLGMAYRWSKACLAVILLLVKWLFCSELEIGLSITSGSSNNAFTIWRFLSKRIHFHKVFHVLTYSDDTACSYLVVRFSFPLLSKGTGNRNKVWLYGDKWKMATGKGRL